MSRFRSPSRPPSAALGAVFAALVALVLAGCGQTTSTASFKGEQHEVAQALVNLQSHVNGGEQQKVCSDDLASSVVARLNTAKGGCTSAVKDQLAQIDNTNLAVDSVTLGTSSAKPSASASVRTIYAGKTRRSTVTLLKQEGKWKLAAVRPS
jgi:hypothetical protein